MKQLTKTNVLVKLFGLLLLFQSSLWAEKISEAKDIVRVSLASFGNLGIIIVVIATSLVGVYFISNELDFS